MSGCKRYVGEQRCGLPVKQIVDKLRGSKRVPCHGASSKWTWVFPLKDHPSGLCERHYGEEYFKQHGQGH